MRGVPAVLAYHKVGTAELGGTWCTVPQFRRHLDMLVARGYRGVRGDEFLARLDRSSEQPAPREFLLTFDDAFESFAQHAWPQIRARGIPVLLFVVSDYVGRRATWDLALPGRHVTHLDWRALRDLVREGVEIGAHGATHRDLRFLDDPTLQGELAGSRKAIEDGLGVEVRSLAYPFGRSNARVQAAVQRAGYRIGFAMSGKDAVPNRWAMPRHGVYRTDGRSTVLAKVDPGHPLHAAVRVAERAISACAELAARREPGDNPNPIFRKSR
jgi:peptidoglycan/xylan/chitin deacetylase (PgdA/CDA1 family)